MAVVPIAAAMAIVADLHIHSRFSRATSRALDFVALYRAALDKGIQLVGTGDFTHPAWLQEIEDQLVPAEDGLFRLRDDLVRAASEGVAPACAGGDVRFVLQVEISNIYKRDGRVRKNHNLVFVPSLHAARILIERLSAIGNLASDGRPILGLDARDLLEITLEADPLAFLVPAHIWTPWFSMLGSKSGFDSLEACFADLAPEVFAAETGLSSDPAMNWRVSHLDRLTLISNSDAHSADKLGREANLLDIELGYAPLLHALRTREGFEGTIEFFPEEGKYHLDGHRKCNIRLEPEETVALEGNCPVCGGKLTVGVMSRVMDLADRDDGYRPAGARPFTSLVSLAEVAGEVLGVGAGAQSARHFVERTREALGPELFVLRSAPIEDISRVAGAPAAEAIRRIRAGELSIAAGYDGEFGTVRIFAPGELDRLRGQAPLLVAEPARPAVRSRPASRKKRGGKTDASPAVPGLPALELSAPNAPLAGLDDAQREVATAATGPLLVVAGPGSGKTRALVGRIAHQVAIGAVRGDEVLAITFTHQAALELSERLAVMLPSAATGAPMVCTFHAFGRWLLREVRGEDPRLIDDDQRQELAVLLAGPGATMRQAQALLQRVSYAKQHPEPASVLASEPEAAGHLAAYQAALRDRGLLDLDDLVLAACGLLRDSRRAAALVSRFRCLCVDEYQDVNDVQAELIGHLSPTGASLCAIGDPDQAIYGFRGARPGHFTRFAEAYAGARVIRLSTSYRLTRNIAAVAKSIIGSRERMQTLREGSLVEIVACATPASEAEQILIRLEKVVGGTSLFAVDTGRAGAGRPLEVGFGDVAVLVRTRAQRAEVLEALGRSAVPCRSVGEDEPHDPRSQKVAVMTMHAAKGREFEVVFVAGVEPGLMPFERAGAETDTREERRLLYVAITRAKRLAVISYALHRKMRGRNLPGGPSPFLDLAPDDAVRRIEPTRSQRARSKQLTLF